MTATDLLQWGVGLIFAGLGLMVLTTAAALAVLLWKTVRDA